MRRYPGTVQNYTTPFLVMACGILFMAFFTLAATKGIMWVLFAAALIDSVIRAGEARLSAAKVSKDG